MHILHLHKRIALHALVLIDKDGFVWLRQQVLQLLGIVLCRVRFEDVRTTLVMHHIHLV